MAITLENLIDLPLLTYYDENLKRWVVNRIDKTAKDTSFVSSSNLPVEGKTGMLYVTEDSIKYWDGQKYVQVGSAPSSSGDLGLWGNF